MQFPETPHAKVVRVISGTIRADDGTVKSPGDELVLGADQLHRFAGQVEYVRDVVPAPAEGSSSAGPEIG